MNRKTYYFASFLTAVLIALTLYAQEEKDSTSESVRQLDRTDFQSEDHWLLHQAEKRLQDSMAAIRAQHTDDDRAFHAAKIAYSEENKDLSDSIDTLRVEIAEATTPPIVAQPIERRREDFPSEDHWLLHQSEQQLHDGMAAIRAQHTDDDRAFHAAKMAYSEENQDLLDSIDTLRAEIAKATAPSTVAQPIERMREDFPSEDHWLLHQSEQQLHDGMAAIRAKHTEDDRAFHAAKKAYIEKNAELEASIAELRFQIVR